MGRAGPIEDLRSTELALRGVRWIAAAFALGQFALYRPPNGTDVPFPQRPVGVLVAALILFINALSIYGARRVTGIDELRRVGLLELVADTAIILAIVVLFSFDAEAGLWALLVIPIIEGARRHELPGAMTVWAVAGAVYVAREVWASQHFDGRHFALDSVTYRLGILLVVAVATGLLARNAEEQRRAHLEARAESERHAALLEVVASSARQMSVLDDERLLGAVTNSVLELGFDAAAVAVLEEASNVFWISRVAGELPDDFTAQVHPGDAGLLGVVRDRGEVVVLDDYDLSPDGHLALRASGVRTVVGAPIKTHGQLAAVLVACSRTRLDLNRNDVAAFQLLACQAGTALENAREFMSERLAAQLLADAAVTDDLTGLGNRRHATTIMDRLEPDDVLVLIELDCLGAVNERVGHAAGDEILMELGAYLGAALRPGDAAARHGGASFVAVFRNTSTDAATLVDDIERGWRARRPLASICVGAAVHERGVPAVRTVGLADLALRDAKTAQVTALPRSEHV